MPDWVWVFSVVAGATGVVSLGIAIWRVRVEGNRRRADETAQQFLAVRRYLKQNRSKLSTLASWMYPRTGGLDGLALRFWPDSIPETPIPIEDVELSLDPQRGGFEPLVASVGRSLPTRADGTRYETYSDAIADLDRPSNFFDGASYRLLAADVSNGSLRLRVGQARYFDFLDTGEALGFEFALTAMKHAEAWKPSHPPKPSSMRRASGNVLDLDRRCGSIGVSTLTLVKRDSWEFWMHRREMKQVASAQNTYHVIPAGEFQPTSANPIDFAADLDLWRNIAREFVEEFLNLEDVRKLAGRPIDFKMKAGLARLDAARQDGELKGFVLGLGIDPLTFKVELLTCLVINASAFDEVAGNPVLDRNDEGDIIGPTAFEEANLDTFLASPILPAGAAALRIAWDHREFLTTALTE